MAREMIIDFVDYSPRTNQFTIQLSGPPDMTIRIRSGNLDFAHHKAAVMLRDPRPHRGAADQVFRLARLCDQVKAQLAKAVLRQDTTTWSPE